MTVLAIIALAAGEASTASISLGAFVTIGQHSRSMVDTLTSFQWTARHVQDQMKGVADLVAIMQERPIVKDAPAAKPLQLQDPQKGAEVSDKRVGRVKRGEERRGS